MKLMKWLGCATAVVLLSACIRQEPLNAEADILTATLPGDVLKQPAIIENNSVTMDVGPTTMLDNLAPEFTLTPGATIVPASGTVQDFSEGAVEYTVTSEDGKWSKTYRVIVNKPGDDPDPGPDPGSNIVIMSYSFENVELKGSAGRQYDVFYEMNSAGIRVFDWASGNVGFAMTGKGTSPELFPTYQVTDGYEGSCLGLTTRVTGTWGAQFNKPIAAGNLFMGSFNMGMALTKPLESTRFGRMFNREPVYLSGWYKYTPGPTYYVLDVNVDGKMRPVPDKTDEFNIYAVFFEPTTDMPWLDGTNVLSATNEQIIATAEIDPSMRVATDEWTEFFIPFVLREGKSIDPDKLANGDYSIAVVFSSSIDGDYFCGAPGSTLLVDEVQLGCKKNDTDSDTDTDLPIEND